MISRLVQLTVRALDAIRGPRKNDDPEHLRTGKRGEDEAYFHLRELGYIIVARNWRSRRRKGEIDLIGWEADTLCFIEVKTRSTRDVKPAEAAVDREKRKELRAMAREYLWRAFRTKSSLRATSASHSLSRSSEQEVCRFDVVSVYYDSERRSVTDITLFRNAFSMS